MPPNVTWVAEDVISKMKSYSSSMGPNPRGCCPYKKDIWTGTHADPPHSLRRNQPCLHLGLRLWSSGPWEKDFLLFNPPGLWCFVTAALGNEYCRKTKSKEVQNLVYRIGMTLMIRNKRTRKIWAGLTLEIPHRQLELSVRFWK